MRKLTLDEREQLFDLVTTEGFTLLLEVLEDGREALEQAMVKLNIGSPEAERELIRCKCRAEGASQLIHIFTSKIESLNPEPKTARKK